MSLVRRNIHGVTTYQKGRAFDGYTLFAPMMGRNVWLIDMMGQAVHQWEMENIPGNYGKLLTNGNLLYAGKLIPSPLPEFGGNGGQGGFGNFDFSSSFSDIFEDFFGDFGFGSSGGSRRGRSNNRGNDLRYDISIDLNEAFTGIEKKINYTNYKKCKTCSGSGSKPGTKPSMCSYCGGNGKVRTNQGFFTIQQTCPECSGEGEKISNPCNICSGIGKTQSSDSVAVKIPKGVDDGTRIRLSGKGEAGTKGGSNGDLYLFISVEPHSIFKRSEENLYYELPISIADAALGTAVEVPSIDGGKTKIKIPSGTQTGKQLRLKGKGMPILKRNVSGDLYIRIITEVPTSLTKKQKELLNEFKTLEDAKSNPLMKTFFDKAKKFWKN